MVKFSLKSDSKKGILVNVQGKKSVLVLLIIFIGESLTAMTNYNYNRSFSNIVLII